MEWARDGDGMEEGGAKKGGNGIYGWGVCVICFREIDAPVTCTRYKTNTY